MVGWTILNSTVHKARRLVDARPKLAQMPSIGLLSPRIQALLSVSMSDLAALVEGECSLHGILTAFDATWMVMSPGGVVLPRTPQGRIPYKPVTYKAAHHAGTMRSASLDLDHISHTGL